MLKCDISLYGILDPARVKGRALDEVAVLAVEGGATILQYRDKISNSQKVLENAYLIKEALEPYDVPLLMNDRVDIALEVGVDGVHLGQNDMGASMARNLLGDDAIIGLTLNTINDAEVSPLDVVDYACIGGVYDTQSKDNGKALGLRGWNHIANYCRNLYPDLPLGAIAGINETNIKDVLNAGVDGVAIISAIFMNDDVLSATQRLKMTVERKLK